MSKILCPAVLFCLLAFVQPLHAQVTDGDIDFNRYDKLYNEKKISGPSYLKTIDSLLVIYVKIDSLFDKLTVYKNIAWGKDSTYERKKRYWSNLYANAINNNEGGVGLYYLQKQMELEKSHNSVDSLQQLQARMFIHGINGNDQKRIEIYQLLQKRLDSMPSRILSGTADSSQVRRSLHIIMMAVISYMRMKDSFSLNNSVHKAETIYDNLVVHNKLTKEKEYKRSEYYLMLLIHSYRATLAGDHEKSIALLQEGQKHLLAIKDAGLPWVYTATSNNLTELFFSYAKAKKYKEAEECLKLVKERPYFNTAQIIDLANAEAAMDAERGNYKEAYNITLNTFGILKKINGKNVEQSDYLLDAFRQAEETRTKLKKAEKDKAISGRMILYISLLSALMVLAGFLIMRHKNAQLYKKIIQLNNAADIQVARLEEMTVEAHFLEQQHLGMELHDSIASELAALVFLTQAQMQDAKSDEDRDALKITNTYLKDLYERSRTKSHELVHRSDEVREETFVKQTESFLNTALSDKHYQKEILIDRDSITKLNVDARIELLRIIQESVINILKHAKAKTVSVLIYEEKNMINLSIADNGKGFDPAMIDKKGSLGLKSIKNRVASMNGNLQIISTKAGTEINVSIPVN
jgi:signal transduction histidine kinase